ncbi:MAG: FemAB-related protein (PEP-CTERM system-associated) [Planctomycetota bacterium]|jgi:FemAB-related protein (PEP-CTERM system-associated)
MTTPNAPSQDALAQDSLPATPDGPSMQPHSDPSDRSEPGPTRESLPSELTVRRVSAADHAAWDAFVDACPKATFFHLTGWARAVCEEFGHEDRGWIALSGERVVGVLPIICCRGLRGGRALISAAYGVYGGPVGESREIEHALFRAAEADAIELKAGRLELRCLEDPGLDLPKADLHATFIRDLPETPEDVLKGMPKKARADARKARKNHELCLFEGRWFVADLVRLFHNNKRSLGSPALPATFFTRLLEIFGKRATVHVVKRGGEPLSAVMSFLFRDQVLAYYSGTGEGVDRAYKASCFMYMALQEWSIEQGYRVFDFGRSRKESGPFSFKTHQGFEARDLHYSFCLVKDTGLPTLNPSNPKTKVLQETWKRLPLALTTRLSGRAARYLP